ncbi:MAG: DUF2752 domain-containing protein [Myxococcota bacterium]
MIDDDAKLPRPRGISLSLWAGLGGAALLLGAQVALRWPSVLRVLWPCPFRAVTTLPCPTCGLTRVLLLLAKGQPLEALTLAPLPTLVLGGALTLGAGEALRGLLRRQSLDSLLTRWLRHRPVRWSAAVFAVVLWGYAIARSLHTGAP